MRTKVLISVACGAVLLAGHAHGASLSPVQGTELDNYEAELGFRVRSFGNTGGEELYLGGDDLGGVPPAGERLDALNFNWLVPGTNRINFEWNPGADTLFASADPGADNVSVFSTTVNSISTQSFINSFNIANANFIQLNVANRDAGTTVDLTNITLNGMTQADITGLTGFNTLFAAEDVSQGVMFQADLELDGSFGNSQELSRVDLTIGYNPDFASPNDPS